MNWPLIISAASVILTIVIATGKLVAAWGAAAHQLAEVRETLKGFGARPGALEAWKERADGRMEAERDFSGRVRS